MAGALADTPPERPERFLVNTKATMEAIGGRLQGKPASRYRAMAIAGTAGAGIAVVVYRSLRESSS